MFVSGEITESVAPSTGTCIKAKITFVFSKSISFSWEGGQKLTKKNPQNPQYCFLFLLFYIMKQDLSSQMSQLLSEAYVKHPEYKLS